MLSAPREQSVRSVSQRIDCYYSYRGDSFDSFAEQRRIAA